MARKKKHPEHVNHERWLVSYADFVTLLFAFFVVMFAVSQVDSKKVGRFAESFKGAMMWEIIPGEGKGMMEGEGDGKPGQKPNEEPQAQRDAKDIKEKIKKKLGPAAPVENFNVEMVRGELVIRLPDTLMFGSAETILGPEGRKALDVIAEVVRAKPVVMRIEGHTDSVPIHQGWIRSNWELSTARATACIAYLVESKSIDPWRLAAAGYGEYRPIAANATAEGRAQNRRVEIVITTIHRALPDPTSDSAPADGKDNDSQDSRESGKNESDKNDSAKTEPRKTEPRKNEARSKTEPQKNDARKTPTEHEK